MTAKLVVLEETRDSPLVPFFVLSADEALAMGEAMNRTGIMAVVGERRLASNLQKIRTLFFPNTDLYNKWNSSAEVANINKRRSAYNSKNNIREQMIVFDVNFTQT